MSSLWLVTPAYRRYDLSEVCFQQHQQVLDVLRAVGIDAQQVVVADDANLEIARALDFATVEQNNTWLGRKFNDGIEYAVRQGADWVVPIGSDSWIDPAYFLPLPDASLTRTGNRYTVVASDQFTALPVRRVGPFMFHRTLLLPSGGRPAEDRIRRGADQSMLDGIGLRNIKWEARDMHPHQYVGFRGERLITPYASLTRQYRVDPMPYSALEQALVPIYGADLVSALDNVTLSSSLGVVDRS